MTDCTECNGTGEIDLSLRAERIVECEACGGSGEVVEYEAPSEQMPSLEPLFDYVTEHIRAEMYQTGMPLDVFDPDKYGGGSE